MSRRSLAAALVVAMTLGLYVMKPTGADAAVASVTGGAFGAYAANISLFGTPQPPNGPHPTVTLPPGGGSVQQSDPDGHAINYGPATLFISGALTVESSGTTGATGSVTSRAHIVGDAEGRDPLRWTDLTQTCSAATNGATSGTTTIVGGTVTSTTGTTTVPTNPPVNHTVTGVVPGANDNFRIVFNERSVDASGVLTITAAHLYLLGPTARGDVFIGQVRCGVTVDTTTPTAPIAGDDSYSTPFETALNVSAPGVLDNDTDANGDAITAEMPTTPANGTVSLNTDGSFTYTPNAGFSGTDTFEYMVHDPGGLMDTGLVTITVGAPPNRRPVANDDTYATPYQTARVEAAPGVLANDTDPDGDALTTHLVSGPANGTLNLGHDGSFTYTPNAGFSGPDTFVYLAHDADDAQDTATVTITVGARPNAAPVANPDTYATDYQTALNVAAPGVLANDTDADGDALMAVNATQPANGSATVNADGSFTFTPNAGFSGTTTFTYVARDPFNADSSPATVTITVRPPPPVAPVAANDSYSTNYQTSLMVNAPGVLFNDTDGNNDPLTAVLAAGPANGTLVLNADGSFSYTPAAGFSGPDSFTYRASDGALTSNVATVTITVGARPASADVSVTVTDSTDPVGVRGELTYTITVANAGPDAAAQVTALINLPAGSRLQSFSGATCTEIKGKMKGLACELGTMADETSTEIVVTVTAPSKPATITASASASSDTADPNPANNSASEQTVVVRP